MVARSSDETYYERRNGKLGQARLEAAADPTLPSTSPMAETEDHAMRALLDTNIVIHREAPVAVDEDIGVLFGWLDRLGYTKCVHPVTVEELDGHGDPRSRRSLDIKLRAYDVIQARARLHPDVERLSLVVDVNENDRNDTLLVNEVYQKRVDLLISEDVGVALKAQKLGIAHNVFDIESFLEKVWAENPELADYPVLAVRKARFGDIDLVDTFFDSLREDYPGFDEWANGKSEEPVYLCETGGRLSALLYLKREGETEPYSDIDPPFAPKRRLKIGTFNGLLPATWASYSESHHR